MTELHRERVQIVDAVTREIISEVVLSGSQEEMDSKLSIMTANLRRGFDLILKAPKPGE